MSRITFWDLEHSAFSCLGPCDSMGLKRLPCSMHTFWDKWLLEYQRQKSDLIMIHRTMVQKRNFKPSPELLSEAESISSGSLLRTQSHGGHPLEISIWKVKCGGSFKGVLTASRLVCHMQER